MRRSGGRTATGGESPDQAWLAPGQAEKDRVAESIDMRMPGNHVTCRGLVLEVHDPPPQVVTWLLGLKFVRVPASPT